MDYKKFIREQKERKRVDMTLLFNNAPAFASLIKEMIQPFVKIKIDKVAAIDATGFVFGTAIARELKVGMAVIRKQHKIAWSVKFTTFTDYSGITKGLEIADDAIKPGEHILIVDDWSETGTQLRAAITLVEQAGGIVSGASLVHIDKRALQDTNLTKYKLHSAVEY
ncbi:MAG: phosphoribosyltransferase family protein [Patescibacteria group bacterium]|jgi:adenine phosphoribosyltransferase